MKSADLMERPGGRLLWAVALALCLQLVLNPADSIEGRVGFVVALAAALFLLSELLNLYRSRRHR